LNASGGVAGAIVERNDGRRVDVDFLQFLFERLQKIDSTVAVVAR
jgi:hypothetical protein